MYEKAINKLITLNAKENIDLYPDYTAYVYGELKELISYQEGFHSRMQGAAPEEKQRLQLKLKQRVQEVLQSGVHIYTGLSRSLQEKGNTVLGQALPMQDVNGAIVVLNHQTHQISAIIGGKKYKKLDFHRAYQANCFPQSKEFI